MFWNHRVIKRTFPDYAGEVQYGIYEVFYDDESHEAMSCTMDPVAIVADDFEDLRVTLAEMAACFDKPVLDYDDFDTVGSRDDVPVT